LKAIFVSGIDYESPIQIGDHHLARQFALNGWDVAFLSTPITPFHMLGNNATSISRRQQNNRSGGHHYSIGKGTIWSYVPCSFIFPKNNLLLNNWAVYQYWHKTLTADLKILLKANSYDKANLIYIRDPLQGFLLNSVEHDFSVFRIADDDSGFPSYNVNYQRIAKHIAQSVDLVLYTAREIEAQVRGMTPRRYQYFPNGVDLNNFMSADRSRPVEYQQIHNPIAVYAGSIDYWFDFDLVNRLAMELPGIDFVIIGPNEKLGRRFDKRKNLHLLGSLPYENLPKYLYNATVGMIPFNVSDYPELVNAISPIKLLEYMACGLPVVATYWNELFNLRSPAFLCSTYDEFKTALESSIKTKIKPMKFQAYAGKHDWSIRYQVLLRIIKGEDKA
jgi:glycosyltransferase involved in cell wall biosynthesis